MREAAVKISGQVLIELVLAIAISSVILVSIVTGTIAARESLQRGSLGLDARLILQKELEAIRAVKETSWNALTSPGPYHIVQQGSGWTVTAGQITENLFTRGFTVEDVCRTSTTSLPVACSEVGAITDPSTKKVTATVSWSGFGAGSLSAIVYITRYWSNATWTQTTTANFNAGTLTNTQVTNDSGGEVKLAAGGGGNWNNPQVIATRDLAGTVDAQDVFVVNDKAYIVTLSRTGSGEAAAEFLIYDVSNPTNPTLQGFLDLGSNAYAVVVAGNYAYVATSHDSRELTVINVSNPALPTFTVTHFNASTGADGRGVAVSGTTAYLVTNNNTTGLGYEFYSVNITDPNYPSQLGGVNLSAGAKDIFLSGNFAYIASTNKKQELQVINVINPSSPTIAGTFDSPGSSDGNSIYAVGTTAYIADARLNILNVSNPANISQIGFYNAPGTPFSVFVSGNFAFLGHSQAGSQFKVIDITNPGSPSQFGSASLGGSGFGVFVSGDYAYLATGADGAEFQVIRGGAGGAFQTLGTFESQTFDAGASAGYNYLTFTFSEPVGTNIRLQIATNNDNATWNFVGPAGTASSYFETSGAIPLQQAGGRYFRFKAFFDGNGSATPTFFDLTVNYSP